MNATAKLAALLCAISLFLPAAAGAESHVRKPGVQPALPLGTWHYGVFVGKTRLGTADVSLSFDGAVYVSSSVMTMQRDNGAVVCVMSETEKETAGFAPVSYSSSTIIISGSKESRALLKATFRNGEADIDDGQEKRTIKIEGPFHITPNVLAAKMTREGLKPGNVSRAMIYDPTVDEEKPVEMTDTVVGQELVELPSGKARLTHTSQTFGPLKNIHN